MLMDAMNIAGFVITVVGFPLTIWSAREARRAAIEAKQSVENYQIRRAPLDGLTLIRAAKACLDARNSAIHPEIQREYNRLMREHLVRLLSFCRQTHLNYLELRTVETSCDFLTRKPNSTRLAATWYTALGNALIALEQAFLNDLERNLR